MAQHNGQVKEQCRKCGTCCNKGGPALHEADRFLVDEGIIPIKHLFTIREGEPAYDNIRQDILPVKSDIIKIKSSDKSQTCRYFDPKNNLCQTYDHRPKECSLLKCWDTKDIENYYDKTRLTRKQLIGNIKGLWEIVREHHQQMAMDSISTFAHEFNRSKPIDPNLENKMAYIIRYDLSVRSLVCEKGAMDPEMLEFLFGRTIIQLLASFGIKTLPNKGELMFKRG